GLERTQRLEIPVQLPGVRVEDSDLAAFDLDRLVAGELDLEAPTGERRVVMLAVETVERLPVHPECRLAPGFPEQVRGRLGDGRRDPEPPRRPHGPEPLPRDMGPVVERLRLLPGDAVDRAGDLDALDRVGLTVDPLVQEAGGLREP